MTRYWAGGGPADYTILAGADQTIGAVTGKEAVVVGGIVTTFWNQETGGTQHTDLLDATGTPVTSVTSSDTSDGRGLGQIPPFQYPDGVTEAWAQAGTGPRVRMPAIVGADVVATATDLAAHKAAANGHSTGVGDLVDVTVPAPASRVQGDMLGVVDTAGNLGLLTPSQVSGAVLLNPPTTGYTGNVVQPPPTGQNEPWLSMVQPYSGGDTNPDAIQLFARHSDLIATIKTFWTNGNNEARGAPSTPSRVAGRFFEAYENRGGPSTSRFFELSTNPTIAANREPLFGAYGTGHSSKPGWMVATRVLEGLTGVKAGGSYNSLTGVNFRGRRTTAGPPTSGTWVTDDLVLDSAGLPWLCAAGGTPGTWVGITAQTAFTAVTPGTDMGHGAKQAASRLDLGGTGRLRGILTASAAVSSGAVLATITAAHRPLAEVNGIVRYSSGGARLTISTAGEITINSGLTNGQNVWLDSITYDLLA